MYINPDLHMHSKFSDGSDSPAELLDNVKKANVDIFALTDHDTYDGCYEVEKLLKPGDPKFIKGIELSCQDGPMKYHVLGYCFDTNKDSIQKAVEITHKARRDKALNRINFLKDTFGVEFPEEDVKWLLSNANPGRPHFVKIMLKNGCVKTPEEGFEMVASYHGKEVRLSPEQAVDAILSSNGIPVLAHGIKGDGSKNLSEEEITNIIDKLKGWGLMGVECFYSTFSKQQKEIMLKLADKFNLLITAGSDYHGTNKPIHIGQTNDPIQEKMKRFYRTIEMLD